MLALAALPALASSALDSTVDARLGEAETAACVAAGVVGETRQVKVGCTAGTGPVSFDEHSLFEIGSISKGFTGLILADMVRRGEVSLDDPASKYSRPGAKLPLRDRRPITLRDLVTQTSGLPRMPPLFRAGNPQNPYADFGEEKLYAALARTPDATDPKYEYSNFGFMWLSDIVARRAGKPYEAVLTERVLVPLGMKETAIALDDAKRKRFVEGHDALYRSTSHWDFVPNLGGVGAIRSTLSDMLIFASALAGRTDTPLKETIALAFEPMRPSGPKNATGFAWITFDRGDHPIRWHNGQTGGFTSILAVNPATRTAAVVLSDSATSFDDLGLHLVDESLPMKKKRVALATDMATLKQYEGHYELAPTFAIDVFIDGGKLMAQATAQPALEVKREAPDVFFYYVVAAKLRFARGADGAVESVTLEQSGRSINGKRAPLAR